MSRRLSRPRVRLEATLQERLDHYTDKSAGPDACWLWQGGTDRGYGRLRWRGRKHRAHRLSFEAANGLIAAGAVVLHRCDNPRCVNPGHLSAGTQRDNMRDMFAKGRRRPPAGERNANAKLTVELVQAIRAATGSSRDIGIRFGVSGVAVRHIKQGRRWRHVPADEAVAIGRQTEAPHPSAQLPHMLPAGPSP